MLWGDIWTSQRLEILGPLRWRAGALEYHCLATIDDPTLSKYKDLAENGKEFALFAPPWCERVFLAAAHEMFAGGPPDVTSLDFVLSFRSVDYCVHTGRNHQKFLADWLTGYNDQLKSDRHCDLLHVEIPKEIA